ncbi:MAG: FHA domain-containing protein [Oligoflexia bacterium]|nr:FHA domain-containing protein [Oligoflexia bacterium]
MIIKAKANMKTYSLEKIFFYSFFLYGLIVSQYISTTLALADDSVTMAVEKKAKELATEAETVRKEVDKMVEKLEKIKKNNTDPLSSIVISERDKIRRVALEALIRSKEAAEAAEQARMYGLINVAKSTTLQAHMALIASFKAFNELTESDQVSQTEKINETLGAIHELNKKLRITPTEAEDSIKKELGRWSWKKKLGYGFLALLGVGTMATLCVVTFGGCAAIAAGAAAAISTTASTVGTFVAGGGLVASLSTGGGAALSGLTTAGTATLSGLTTAGTAILPFSPLIGLGVLAYSSFDDDDEHSKRRVIDCKNSIALLLEENNILVKKEKIGDITEGLAIKEISGVGYFGINRKDSVLSVKEKNTQSNSWEDKDNLKRNSYYDLSSIVIDKKKIKKEEFDVKIAKEVSGSTEDNNFIKSKPLLSGKMLNKLFPDENEYDNAKYYSGDEMVTKFQDRLASACNDFGINRSSLKEIATLKRSEQQAPTQDSSDCSSPKVLHSKIQKTLLLNGDIKNIFAYEKKRKDAWDENIRNTIATSSDKDPGGIFCSNSESKKFQLKKGMVFGRSERSNIKLKSATSSRAHAIVEWDNTKKQYFIKDDSQNGTTISSQGKESKKISSDKYYLEFKKDEIFSIKMGSDIFNCTGRQ